MLDLSTNKKIIVILSFFVVGIFVVGTPIAEAATFQMQTGSYVGDGTDDRTITGLGFQPELLILKDNTNVGNNGSIFKTASMAAELSLVIAETDGNLTTNHIQSLDTDGFTVGNDNDVNSANVMYWYVAFEGSDCTATGTFCENTYTGTAPPQSITNVGFQPDLVVTKRAAGTVGTWRSSAMTGTQGNFFNNVAQAGNQRITSLDATGFSVGNNIAANNNGDTYYYFAFQEVASFMDVGTYTGNGTDGTTINSTTDANLTFQPDFAWTKAETNQHGVASIREHNGDRSFQFNDSNNNRDRIQDLLSAGGFEIGTNARVNSNAVEYNYVAFAGAPARAAGTGTYDMAEGTYAGTGAGFSLTGLGFEPDLVILKGENTDNAVFRTSLMSGDRTAFLGANLANFAGGILSLDTDGFSVGTDTTTNENTTEYYWTAFGNAFRMDRTGGAADFMVGQYIGTARDDVDVEDIPIAPDFMAVKRTTVTTNGVWKTASQVAQTLRFHAAAQANNRIQAFNTDGFQLGTNNQANANGSIYDYFIFVEGSRFDVGTYTGTGAAADITASAYQPDLLWLKKTTGGTARAGVLRSSEQTGDAAQSFITNATATNLITDLILNGFSLGTGNESNENTFTYQYAVWNNKSYDQRVYRFFDNADSTDVGAALAASDTPAALAAGGDAFRLRMLTRVDGGNLFTSAEEFKLQFAERVGTCDTSFTSETYADVTGATLIAFNDNGTPADDDTLTANASDPIDGARVIVNQSYQEANDVTNNVSGINQVQTGKWDFSLIDNAAPGGFSYCFRLVYNDGTVLETYTSIPEIKTRQEISFSISDNTVDFGSLSSSASRYADGTVAGSTTPVTAHTIDASTNADGGYVITVDGLTLTCIDCGTSPTIDAIGATATAPTIGIEQFGFRSDVASGTGSVSAPYNTANFAFDTASIPDTIFTGPGDSTSTTFNLQYLANISTITDGGSYETALTYTITPTF